MFAPTIEDAGDFWVAMMAGPDGNQCVARMDKAQFTHAQAACAMMLAVQQEFKKHELSALAEMRGSVKAAAKKLMADTRVARKASEAAGAPSP